jgi:hypothetical protein
MSFLCVPFFLPPVSYALWSVGGTLFYNLTIYLSSEYLPFFAIDSPLSTENPTPARLISNFLERAV